MRGSTTSSMSFWYSAAISGTECPGSGRTCSEPRYSVWKLSPANTRGSSASGGNGGRVLSRGTHVEHDARHVGADLELRPTLPKPRFDSERISSSPGFPAWPPRSARPGPPRSRKARLAPRRIDAQLGLPRVGQQLDRQAQQCERAESRTMVAAAATAAGFWALRSASLIACSPPTSVPWMQRDEPALGVGESPAEKSVPAGEPGPTATSCVR